MNCSHLMQAEWAISIKHVLPLHLSLFCFSLSLALRSCCRNMACSCGGECLFSSSSSPFTSQSPPTNRRLVLGGKTQVIQLPYAELSEPHTKRANLSARRKESIKLPNYVDDHGRIYPISEFLSHPSGVEAILNTRALQSFESLDSKTYRCTLPKIQLLKFEVAPVMDLRVTATSEDCTVEMLSCKFHGSEAVERQNDHFSAFMINHIKWDANGSEPSLDVDVELNLTLEIYTRPFTLIPISAVENPGNLIMQALVDKLVPMLLEQLLQDYEKWVQEQCEISP